MLVSVKLVWRLSITCSIPLGDILVLSFFFFHFDDLFFYLFDIQNINCACSTSDIQKLFSIFNSIKLSTPLTLLTCVMPR